MKRSTAILVLAVCGAHMLTVPAEAKRVARPGQPRRTVVVVSPGWPLQRSLRAAVLHPARMSVQATSTTFLAPLMFFGATIAAASAPSRDEIVWEDGETLSKNEEWTVFTLGCDTNGRQLWLQIPSGRMQFDWAEVVFDNGDAQVVDFAEKTFGPGMYSLFDAVRGRKVDHVRVLARAKSDEAKVMLQMQKS